MTRRSFLAATAASAAQPDKPPVIDCHTHVGTAHTLTAPWTTIADPAEILRRNRQAGIDKACVFPISHETFEAANREVAEIARRHPDRFIGFAKHDPVREKGRIREMLFRECRELGLRGLKLHVAPTVEVLDAVAELRIPILWHPAKVALFAEPAKSYPSIDFILAHLGSDLSADWREHVAAIDMAGAHHNVYLDTGGTVLTRYLEQAVKTLGAGKIIFGSDEPEVDCRLEIFKVRVLALPPEQQAAILGANMLRLLGKYGTSS